MFIKPTRSYYTYDGSQHASRQWFLILLQPPLFTEEKLPIRAVVRKVALSQLGHFMMGIARIKGHSIVCSGSYGGDGLPKICPTMEIYNTGIVLPDDLVKAWNTGGGWNSAGSEASAMRQWAIANFAQLAPKGARL